MTFKPQNCLHAQNWQNPKTESKEPPPPQPRDLREEDGFVTGPAQRPLTFAAKRALGTVVFYVESFPSKDGFRKGHPGFATSSSNGSELYSGAVEYDRSCATVYGPDSLQEKWLGVCFFFLLFGWVFLFPLQICTALLHACLIQKHRAQHSWPLLAPFCQ